MSEPFAKNSGQPTDSFAFEALSVAGTAVGFTEATHSPSGATSGTPAISAHVSVEGAQVRWRADGTDPTATVGTILNEGDEIVVWGTQDIRSIKFIRTGGVSATLNTDFAR